MAFSVVGVDWIARSGRNRLDVPIPAAAIEDDYLIFRCLGTVTTNDGTSPGDAPAGMLNVACGTRFATILTKKMTASDASASTLRVNFTASGNISVAVEVRRGQDLTTPFDVTPSSTYVTSTTDPASITTVTAGSAVIAYIFGDDDTPGVTAAPSGYTEDQLIETSPNITPPQTQGSASKIITPAGAEDPGAWTGSTTNNVSMVIALRDANPPASGVEGTVDYTENPDTSAATGALTIRGVSTITEAPDTLNGVGTLTIRGDAAITESPDTLASNGIVGISQIDAVVDYVEAPDTAASTGQLTITAAVVTTETGDTLASTGDLTIRGTANITEAGDTLASTGQLSIQGSVNVVEVSDIAASTATLTIRGSAVITEARDTLVSSGEVRNRIARITGEAGNTVLGTLTIIGETTVFISGVSATVEQGIVPSTAVFAPITGLTGTVQQNSLNQTNSANVAITGVTATGSLGQMFFWVDIVPGVTDNWTGIDPNAPDNWTDVVPGISSIWTDVVT